MKYIDQQRIRTHVISRYHLSMDIVQLIVSDGENHDDPSMMNEIYEDAVNIQHTVDLLRSKFNEGPKTYWKVDAHFFNKIDNYLSVLICVPLIQQLYLKHFPDFLYEEKASDEQEINELVFDECKSAQLLVCIHKEFGPLRPKSFTHVDCAENVTLNLDDLESSPFRYN